jgi:hypothetical protein
LAQTGQTSAVSITTRENPAEDIVFIQPKIAPENAQTNPNYLNSIVKTNIPSIVAPNCIITGRAGFTMWYDCGECLVIEY